MSSQSQSQASYAYRQFVNTNGVNLLELELLQSLHQNSLYVRFIGDISIDKKDFGKFQKDKVLEVNKWAGEIKKSGKGKCER
jgi:hypothetical protein